MLNVLLDGIFYNGHGLAEGNRILLRFLDRAGFRVQIRARDGAFKNSVLDPEEVDYISAFEQTTLTSKDIYLFNWVGAHARAREDFKVNIARTTFECDRIPSSWVNELNRFDEVWVQSRFNLKTFRASGITVPMRLIPNFFDIRNYRPKGPKLSLPVQGEFLFLSVFDLKKRKGYDLLLRAFLDEFTSRDRVALVVKIRDGNRFDLLERIIAQHPRPAHERPPVYIIHQMLSTSELHALYRTCDAFVLPTRGEGWGRPFFEAMLMELPVIGTNWSGQTDFMNETNAYLIPVDHFNTIQDNENQAFIGHRWAEPSLSGLRRLMRRVVTNRVEAIRKGKKARQDLMREYSMEATYAKVAEALAQYESLVVHQR